MGELVRFPFRNVNLLWLAERYLRNVPGNARCVGTAIVARYRTRGLPWDLSVSRIAIAANLSEPQARKALRTLVEYGFLHVDRPARGSRPAIYRINFWDLRKWGEGAATPTDQPKAGGGSA